MPGQSPDPGAPKMVMSHALNASSPMGPLPNTQLGIVCSMIVSDPKQCPGLSEVVEWPLG